MYAVSVDDAIKRGFTMVYGPFPLCVFGIPFLVICFGSVVNMLGFVLIPSMIFGIVLAWLMIVVLMQRLQETLPSHNLQPIGLYALFER